MAFATFFSLLKTNKLSFQIPSFNATVHQKTLNF
jgi:hypothetical protein